MNIFSAIPFINSPFSEDIVYRIKGEGDGIPLKAVVTRSTGKKLGETDNKSMSYPVEILIDKEDLVIDTINENEDTLEIKNFLTSGTEIVLVKKDLSDDEGAWKLGCR